MIEACTPDQRIKLRHLGAVLGMEEDADGFPFEVSEWAPADTPDVRGIKTRTRHYFDPLHDSADALRLVLFYGLTHERVDHGLFIRNRAGRMVKWKQGAADLTEQTWLELFRAAIFDAAYIVSHDPLGMAENPGRKWEPTVQMSSLYGIAGVPKPEPGE